jgi:magnesium chelatase family protein
MIARVYAAALEGLNAREVTVEVDLAMGMLDFNLVGLPDTAIKEAKERVHSAIRNSDLEYPYGHITINLAPAEVRKSGTWYDLPMALGMLAASAQIPQSALDGVVAVGELSLDGSVRAVPGVLSAALMCKDTKKRALIVPAANAAEAACFEGVQVFGVSHLAEAASFLRGHLELEPHPTTPFEEILSRAQYELDLADVKGQEHAKRALEVAAAGAHNMLMLGPPGSGKTMLSERMPSIMPPLTPDEAIEVSAVYSITGQLTEGRSLVTTRPFRHPHYTISGPGLIGGGTIPQPGEISLAHNGVLFLDELMEFPKSTLELLRQPLEDGQVTIARAQMSATFPSRFLLLAATNPCPCGYYGDPTRPCRCSMGEVLGYRKRLSGPLLDRVDIVLEVPRLPVEKITGPSGESSAVVRERVRKAWAAQMQRFSARRKHRFNSHLRASEIEKICALDEAGTNLLNRAHERLGLTARGYQSIKRVARTIADLDGAENIKVSHLAEAIQYRAGEERLRMV